MMSPLPRESSGEKASIEMIATSRRSRLDDLLPELRTMLGNFTALPMRAVLAHVSQFRIRADDVLRGRSRLCKWASREGYLDLLKWAHERDYPLLQLADGRDACAAAARGGHLALLQWLRANKCRWNFGTCRGAAKGGHLEVLQWARECGCPWNASVAVAAAGGGHLHVLQWLWSHGGQWGDHVTRKAAQCGHREVLEWALANGCPLHPLAAAAAICCSGDLRMVEWAMKQQLVGWKWFGGDSPGLTLNVLCLVKNARPDLLAAVASNVTEQLARVGDLAGLEWACENDCFDSEAVGRGAARGGQLAVLQWAHKNGFPATWECEVLAECAPLACLQWAVATGKRPSAKACSHAARGGRLSALQWLREIDCEWDGETLAKALYGGHWEVFEWARQHGCPVDTRVIQDAARGGYAEVLKWACEAGTDLRLHHGHAWCKLAANPEVLKVLREHGCEWSKATCTAFARDGNLELLQWARRNGCSWNARTCAIASRHNNLTLLKWAYENGCPMDSRTRWDKTLTDLENEFEQ